MMTTRFRVSADPGGRRRRIPGAFTVIPAAAVRLLSEGGKTQEDLRFPACAAVDVAAVPGRNEKREQEE
jgi:hypothetical protein